VKGFSKALLQEHIPLDVLTEREVIEGLDGYRVLILPNASSLSAEAKEAIRAFAARGGGIVASYEAAMYDESGHRTPDRDLSDLFGVTHAEKPPTWFGFDVYMQVHQDHELRGSVPIGKRNPTGGIQVRAEPTHAEIVAQVLGGAAVHYGPLGDELGPPAMLISRTEGGGRTVFFAPPLEIRYLEFGVEDHRKVIAAGVQWAADCRPPIRLANAPQTMAKSAFRQPIRGRTIVHLVNSVRDELAQAITEASQGRDVKLEVDHSLHAECSLVEGRQLSWSVDNGTLVVTIPSVLQHAVVVVEH
jgi:hypothetical protein